MAQKRIYICTPEVPEERIDERNARIDVLAARISERGHIPVWSSNGTSIQNRIGRVLKCSGVLLDSFWKTCDVCKDEYAIAQNHRMTFYHTIEEWEAVSERFVL